ncbi:ChaN family lipoprotein [Pseudoalteromonas ruthenica]|uniref:ChaN family lipoprotein n=1 Tax=Pseudoalteromonas ruthenica TaxID=151081 RepID=UPI00241EF2DF|nr:ChaN family lipoprotein [Pseudoalteromonas ruthenica]|tara:strand:+ start:47075 stop:47845 length:771 start_codon:yes stop_codon:yes gene_type:complete
MNKINKDVNYRKMAGSARLILLAESSHNPVIYKHEAIKALRQLKAAGFTHFAMEMLPRSMQEKILQYQQTGKGFKEIQRYFDENWAWGYLVPKAYGELAKAAQDIGLKIVALDISQEMMAKFDKECVYKEYENGQCLSTHTRRNKIWADNITAILNQSKSNRLIAFMHRWHAVQASEYEPGLDTLMQERGISNIRLIDYIGGISCLSQRHCEGESTETETLKQQYFYREGFPHKHFVKAFQVHVPERKIDLDGKIQ